MTARFLRILAAIFIGNAAYEAGNISGAVLGIEAIFGKTFSKFDPLMITFLAFILLFIGNYKVLEKSLVMLVILMSISFLLTAAITTPNWKVVLKGIFIPTLPKNSLLTIIGLVGTTIVTYNLFLHASMVK